MRCHPTTILRRKLTRSLSYTRRRLQITALEAEFERRKEEYVGELERAKKVCDSESDYLG